MNPVGALHGELVFKRRTRVLADALAASVPDGARTVLDVGCGDGTIAALLQSHRPRLSVTGVDVMVRPDTKIPVREFDGVHLPFADDSFDVVMFVDVLHHTEDPSILLREAKRVARQSVVIKDHSRNSPVAYAILRFMDWVGNAHHGVVLPYNYWSDTAWREAFARTGLSQQARNEDLGLYPFPASLVFERNLHFLSRLGV